MIVAVRFAPASAVPMLMEELGREGIALVTFDDGAIKDGPALLAALGRALAFRPDYGQNWDAAAECLRGLGEQYPQGAALFIERAGILWQRLPRKMGMLTSLWLAPSEATAAPLRLIFPLEEGP